MTATGRRVRFVADYDYKPSPSTTIAYRAGMVEFVRLECAERAIRSGKAVAVGFEGPPAGIAATIVKRRRRKVKADG